MNFKLLFVFILSILCLLTICNGATAANTTYTYTNDDDFNMGNIIGLNVTNNQIQLSNNSSSSNYPFIWVPNSNEGTVSKVNTITGLEIARYRTGPYTYANPSRTTVDLEGSCWVGNRNIGTAVKIGLLENGGYIDRNNDGIIQTSRDLDGNGVITSDEILSWGQDECVLYEVILIPGREGNYTPGTYSGPYANDYYNPGPRGLAIDSQNNLWIGTYGTQRYYYVNGSNGQILKTVNVPGHSPYGAVIDQYGILWSSGNTGNNILRLDPSTDSFTRINVPHTAYGLALDRNNHLFVSGLNYNRITRINVLTSVIEWTKSADYAQGLTVTDDGDVWSANNIQGTVTRYSNDGVIKARIIVGNTPSGVSVDNQGKVWAVDNGDEYIHRINPSNNQLDNEGNIVNGVEFSKRIVGSTHYGYSDMTGVLSNTITTNRGVWVVVHDSEVNGALWGVVSWNGFEPQGTRITVRVRSSNDKVNWSTWETVTNGALLGFIPRGRFLEVETTLERTKGSVSPVLYDLSVRVLSADVTLMNMVDNLTPKLGDTVRFVTVVTNGGLDPATGLRVSPVVPAGFSLGSLSHGSFVDGVWVIDNLNPDEVAVLEFKGVITSDLTSKNVVYSASETHNEYDPNQSSAASASFYVPVSNIMLSSGTVNGRPALFVRNNGSDHAFNVGVQTSLPGGATSSTSQGFYSLGLWYVGTLAPGALATLSLNFPTYNVANPVNVVSGYKKFSKNSKYGKRSYYAQRGNIPPPHNGKDRSVPMQDTGLPLNFSAIAILFIFFASYLNRNNDKIKPNKWLALFIILFFALLFVGNVNAADGTYNSTDDFNNGIYNNINGSEDKLKLNNSSNSAHNYIWVPNTNEATISKVNVHTGQEVARYRTSPQNNANPCRTVVDYNGSCWVANYQTGTVVKIGLLENGGYIDRNHDGIVQTSQDIDHNGIITGNEILPWGQDECVLYEVVFIPGREGNYTPGTYTGPYANDWTNPGPLAIVLDSNNNVWVGCYAPEKYFCLNGVTGQILKTVDVSPVGHTPYGAVIDENGILWSVAGQYSNLLRLDTNTGSFTRINLPHWTYALALDRNNHLFVTGYANSCFSRINTLSGTIEWTKPAPYGSRGLIVTEDGDVWIASLESSIVNRFSNDGTLKAVINPGNRPSALSIDSFGKVWALDYSDDYIHRIDPAINGVDLSKRVVYGTHYGYSQMTVPKSNTYNTGTWTVIHDSLTDNAYWGTVSWNSYKPAGMNITVRVRSSQDKNNWSAWEEAINGVNLHLTPSGRYLEVLVTLEGTGGVSPELYDLNIKKIDSNVLSADLAVTITGNVSSLNPGETVKLTIFAVNNGLGTANVKVNYKIPYGLKLLSSQGQGTYDPSLGVWIVGNLARDGSAAVDLVLQATDAGSMTNTANIYSDLPDLNTANNQVNFGVVVNAPSSFSPVDPLPYTFPPDIVPPSPYIPPQPPQPPIPPKPYIPPTPPLPPGPGPGHSEPKTQLQRDINYVRDTVGYNPTPDPVTNSTTPKPEMPGWDVDWGIAEDIALAAAIITSGIIFLELGTMELGNSGLLKGAGVLGRASLEEWLNSKTITPDKLILASAIVTLLSPPSLHASILLVVDYISVFLFSLGFTTTNIYNMLSLTIMILGLAMILNKLMSGDIENIWKDSVFSYFIELLKKLFGFKK